MPTENESSAPAVSMMPRMLCKKCGYALIGLESRQCPECGRPFDPANRKTFAQKPPRGWVWRWGKRAAALVILLMLAAGAGLGWLWWGWHAEQKTIARIRGLDQQLTVAPIGPQPLRWVLGKRWAYLVERVNLIYLRGRTAAETAQLDLGSLSHMQTLMLGDCEVSNSTLRHLAGLKDLRELSLWDLNIEKPDLAFLEKLPALSTLKLSGDWLAQAGLEHVGRLNHLKVLSLNWAPVKDAELQSLQGLSSLEELDLSLNPLSDAGLDHLHGLKSLRVLVLDDRLLGSQGVVKLNAYIPGLRDRTRFSRTIAPVLTPRHHARRIVIVVSM